MKLIADNPRASMDIRTGDAELTIRVAPESKRVLDELLSLGGKLTVEVKRYRPQRSLDANAYLWVLCDKIAAALGSTKELIYIELVRRVGRFDVVAVKQDAAESLIHGWSCRGLGWFALEMDGCKLDGCTRVMLYYGSSTYDTAEMSRLIDEAVTEAKGLGLDTATPDEVARMMGLWNEEQKNEIA